MGIGETVTEPAAVGLTVPTLAEGLMVRVLYEDAVIDIEGDSLTLVVLVVDGVRPIEGVGRLDTVIVE